LNFWGKLVSGNTEKLSYMLYRIILEKHTRGEFHSTWLVYVKNTLNECGLSYIFDSQSFQSPNWLRANISLKLRDQYKQNWHDALSNSTKCSNYMIFKSEWKFENYLNLLPFKLRKYYCSLRISNHKLPVELGRHQGIYLNDRLCKLCNQNEVGDEYHYLMKCNYFENERRMFLPRFCLLHPSAFNLQSLCNNPNKKILLNLGKVCMKIVQTF